MHLGGFSIFDPAGIPVWRPGQARRFHPTSQVYTTSALKAMLIFYMDDTGDNNHVGFSALGLPSEGWKGAYENLVEFRRQLVRDHKIQFSAELHATKFIRGKGTAAQAVRDEGKRIEIFNKAIDLAAAIPNATLISAFDKRPYEERLYERLMNRINRCAEVRKTQAIIISDEGKDSRFRSLARKLGKHNPIPSQFGVWDDGSAYRNVPNDQIIEDVIFRTSEGCRFVQLADFCAYALLRFEVPSQDRPQLSASFRRLDAIQNRAAFAKDPRGMGIVRGN